MTGNSIFETANLGFAAYLLASRKLRFVGVRKSPTHSRIVQFQFDDPEHLGPSLDLEFGSGDPQVGAVSFHRALRSLRMKIDQGFERKMEESYGVNKYSAQR